MGIWNFYFIAKLFLYFGHYIGFHALPNLAFAATLAIPIRHPRIKVLRQVLAVPVGIALFYYDTWLPPISRVITQSAQLEAFSLTYLAELTGRFISLPVVGTLLVLYVLYFFASKKLRVSAFVFVAMLVLLLPITALKQGAPVATSSEDGDVDTILTDAELTAALNSFYVQEEARMVSYAPPSSLDAPFDIIFLQICSLSWDDLKFTGEQDNPLFQRFDIIFTHFNTAASYSGPAAIRLLRGSCGQQKHTGLYDPAAPQCQTFNELEQIGFEPQLAMNHDGHYGGFLTNVREGGALKATLLDTRGMPAYLQSFDGTPVHDDYSVLSTWWKKRLAMPAQRVALFYNSVSLHDGNRYVANRSASSMEIYHPRQTPAAERC